MRRRRDAIKTVLTLASISDASSFSQLNPILLLFTTDP